MTIAPALVTQTFIPGPRLIDGTDLNTAFSQVNAGLTLSSAILANAVCTASLNAQTNTTFAAITGLSLTVVTGGTYIVDAHLIGSSGAVGGLKAAMGGTATATSSNVTSWNYNGTTINAVTNQTVWGSNLTATAAIYTDLIIQGSVVVQTGGTVTLQAAQQASSGTNTTVLSGSVLALSRVS